MTLNGFQRDDRLRPIAERNAPVFWVRRVHVLSELHAGHEYVIRDVRLRRGLNVIWAPPIARKPALFESGVAGHTAGKTTFCRLIRYALGEGTFATESTRKRIRSAFPSGWVLAEVLLTEEPWVVGRPFAIGAHSFCAKSATIESLFTAERSDYRLFRERLAEVALEGLASIRFPSDVPIEWDHLLPWLARDQECRFGDFLSWRDPSSDSETPKTTVAERQFVVRALLGLLTEAETREQRRNAELIEKRKTALEQVPLLMHHARLEHARIERRLGLMLPPPSSDLFGSQVEDELRRRTAVIDDRLARLKENDPRHELQMKLEGAIQNEVGVGIALRQIQERLAHEKATLDQLRSEAAGEAQLAVLASLPPSTGYCSVPMSAAREAACPLALSAPLRFGQHSVRRTAAEEVEQLRAVVGGLEAHLQQIRSEHERASAELAIARRVLLQASTSYEQETAEVQEQKATLTHIENLASEARDAWRRAEAESGKVASLDLDIHASYARQEELRDKTREALRRFSSLFNFIIRALLGDDVEGEVGTSGRDVTLVVNQDGERESAALSTAKLLAFDLAALASSVEGDGYHPRFLMHDGPREADLSPDVYARLFLLVREFEKQTAVEPPFQYIVSTTTPPPEEFQTVPWLRLKLSGVPSTERLLKRDL